jgi:hypothetical protein
LPSFDSPLLLLVHDLLLSGGTWYTRANHKLPSTWTITHMISMTFRDILKPKKRFFLFIGHLRIIAPGL